MLLVLFHDTSMVLFSCQGVLKDVIFFVVCLVVVALEHATRAGSAACSKVT